MDGQISFFATQYLRALPEGYIPIHCARYIMGVEEEIFKFNI
jgi:hypothetical protein